MNNKVYAVKYSRGGYNMKSFLTMEEATKTAKASQGKVVSLNKKQYAKVYPKSPFFYD
jgi:hypothetical protein